MKSVGVCLLPVGQVGAKQQWLACANLLNYGLFYNNKCIIPKQLAVFDTSNISTRYDTSGGIEPGGGA